MFGTRVFLGKRERDEAEKPFWISFSDFMTALMTLFLIVMVISLLSVTKQIREVEKDSKLRQEAITRIKDAIEVAAAQYDDVFFSKDRATINFGQKAQFDSGKHRIKNGEEGARLIRQFVPQILNIAESTDGQRWLKRIIAEGYTDKKGGYLVNLNLSLQRAQRVVCILLDNVPKSEHPLSEDQKRAVQELFLVGGYSFNSAKETDEESRRVELKLEFLALNEERSAPTFNGSDLGRCQLDWFK